MYYIYNRFPYRGFKIYLYYHIICNVSTCFNLFYLTTVNSFTDNARQSLYVLSIVLLSVPARDYFYCFIVKFKD